MNLNPTYLLYLLVLLGSIAFGFEAATLGLKGRLMVLYRRSRKKTIALSLCTGLAIAVASIGSSLAAGLEPIYLCPLLIAFSLVAAGILNLFKKKFVKPAKLPLPKDISDEELRRKLKNRGF
jgi:hypothetical protein